MTEVVTPLKRLALEILQKANELDQYFRESEAPAPSLDREGDDNRHVDTPENVKSARIALLNLSSEMKELLTDPMDSIAFLGMTENYTLNALRTLCQFEVPQNVPLEGSISYGDLARKSKLNETILSRCVRLAITKYFFAEPERGFVAHSTRSRMLATNQAMRACINLRQSLFVPAGTKLCEMIEKYPDTSEPPETAAQLAFGERFFDYMDHNPQIQAQFGMFMKEISSGKHSAIDSAETIAKAYPFGDHNGKTIVDVGGGIGHVSIAIAEEYPQIKFIVQDKPNLAEQVTEIITKSGLSSRIEFLPHDFFEPQPDKARGASMYFLRNVVHNWPESFAKRILENVVDAMGVESKMLICDPVLPEPGEAPNSVEMMARNLDMAMWINFGGRERSLAEWKQLLESVDERLHITRVIGPPKMRKQRILEVMLKL